MADTQPVLEVSSLGIDTVERTLVDDVSLTVHPGEVLALVGESGSGKSLTGKAILGLLPDGLTASGSITVAGEQIIGRSERDLQQLRGSRAAMVFQEPQTALNPSQRVGTQLRAALRAHRKVSRAEAHARAIALLTDVGIPDPQSRVRWYPHQLSGGQKQRVVIALALAAEPDVLVADEPTTALDVTVQADILALFRLLCTTRGIAILMITHNMGVVAALADRVAVMHHGQVVETATTAQLLTAPTHDYTRKLLAAVPVLRTDERPAAALAETPVPVEVVTVENLTVQFGEFSALEEVSISVGKGHILGVVGESGSGKSTLGRAILGLQAPTRGTVALHTDKVALIHQDPFTSLDPRWTVAKSITEPLRLGGVRDRAQLAARARELIDAVQLPAATATALPRTLSGGQRQRVALARALATEPALIVADEPTSALDVSVQAAVIALFTELQQAFGFAVVFITHDLAVVSDIADTVTVLRGGRQVETGPAATLFGSPKSEYTRALVAAIPSAAHRAEPPK